MMQTLRDLVAHPPSGKVDEHIAPSLEVGDPL
jgi:hypothetical protein